ncbi:MAG: glycosyltransferase [Steroidobacteraceae bacterium]
MTSDPPQLATACRMNPIRLLSINNYHYVRGGAEKVFLEQNKELRHAGMQVAEFCMKHDLNQPSPWDRFFVSNLEFDYNDRALTKLLKAGRVLWNRESKKQLNGLIRAFSPTIVHVHNIYHHISFSILPVLKDHGLPVVITLHDLKLLCPSYTMYRDGQVCQKCAGGSYWNAVRYACVKNSRLGSLVAAADNFLARTLGVVDRNVDAYIVPSQFYRQLFIEHGIPSRKLFYIPNFTQRNDLATASTVSDRFLYFGRLSREKGVHLLIHAASSAGVKLSIAGSGAEEPKLRQLSRNLNVDCDFLGHVTGIELQEAISKCRAVIVPSIWYENAPLSALEAMKSGKIIVASRIGGISELIKEGQTGFLFEPNDVQALTQALTRINGMSEDEIAMMEDNCRSSAQKYTVDAYIQNVKVLYTNLLHKIGT